jgi:AmiR/NasT family two-component response regulator
MMTDLRRRTHPASRRVIDLAIGILMGLRGCSEQDAFNDHLPFLS